MTDFKQYVGQVVRFGDEEFEVHRHERPSNRYPQGRNFATRHHSHHAVLVDVTDEGVATLKVCPHRRTGKERGGIKVVKDVPFSEAVKAGAWSPDGSTYAPAPEKSHASIQ